MSLQPFRASKSLTLGVELELQLINTYDYDLVDSAEDLLNLLKRKPFPGDVKPEVTLSMIEIATDVQADANAVRSQLLAMRDVLTRACDRLNIHIAGGGTHPYQHWFERSIGSTARFIHLSELYGYLAKQFTIFGQHIHIGCQSADESLFLLHALGRYVPHFIALSASSPFIQGTDTQFDSSRLNSVMAFPLSGRAPFVLQWQAFVDGYFNSMVATGLVKSMKDFYWDLRPKPEYGTLELRVCDTPLTMERTAALAGYFQEVCAYLLRKVEPAPKDDDYMVYSFNRFQACRFGLDGTLVHPQTLEHKLIRDDIRETIEKLSGRFSPSALEEILQIVERNENHASWLRRCYTQSGSMIHVVQSMVEAMQQGLPRD